EGYGGIRGITSVYFVWVVLMVAVVPKLKQATCGSIHPAPITSQALSAAAAMSGSPAGIPVCILACSVMTPSVFEDGTNSGRISLGTGTACHFQSQEDAQSCFL